MALSSIVLSGLSLACIFSGALFGALLRRLLPQHHLSTESKEIVRLATGLVGTMTALLLGLLVASAKSSYDTDAAEVAQMSAKIVFLDRLLANYGEEARESRESLRRAAERVFQRMWPEAGADNSQLDPAKSSGEELLTNLQNLSPQDDTRRALKAQAISAASDLGQMRWLLFAQDKSSISMPILAVVVAWLTVTFISFGMYAPFNFTVMGSLLICALSVACAIGLLLELDRPFDGLIHISGEPMRRAIMHMGK
jgi:hypothetical protein